MSSASGRQGRNVNTNVDLTRIPCAAPMAALISIDACCRLKSVAWALVSVILDHVIISVRIARTVRWIVNKHHKMGPFAEVMATCTKTLVK